MNVPYCLPKKTVLFLALVVLLASCQTAESILNSDVPSSSPRVSSIEADASSTPTPPAASSTVRPISTPKATSTKKLLTVTNTVTTPPPTPTTGPVSTLTIAEEAELLRNLVATNGGCDLPCWWGISPGKTQVKEARDLFTSQGVDHWNEEFDKAYVDLFLGYPHDIGYFVPDVGFRLYPGQGVVEVIHVLAEGYPTLGDYFVRDWQPYAASSILAEYGVPAHIQLGQMPRMEPTSPQKYFVVLSYPGLGLEIQYDVFYERLNNTIDRVCFNLENVDHLAILLHTPDYRGELPVSLLPVIGDVLSWEDATGEGTNEFYETLLKPGNDSCVELPWQ